MLMLKHGLSLFIFIIVALSSNSKAQNQFKKFRVEAEAASTWQSRNDVRIPGNTGTEFSLSDFSSGPFYSHRVYLWYNFNERHSLRVLYAPFDVSVNGTSANDIVFDGTTFTAGDALEGTYQFNSYRLAYLYHFKPKNKWKFWLGFSAKIRDAKITLKNSTTNESYSNVGFVPLLLARAEYHFNSKLWVLADIEALAAPQGRAEDATVQLRYRPFKQKLNNVDFGIGYRTVEGGADNDTVKTFAWLHYALFSIGASF